MNEHQFVAVGDIVTDAFIRLKEASVSCDVNKEHCTLSMRFGDKIPYEFVEVIRAVGNSANAAVSASRIGLTSALVSNVGDDTNGKECLEHLVSDKVDAQFVHTNPGMETNYHYVLWYEDDRTILVKHQEYKSPFPNIGEPKWLYLSSLGEHTLPYHKQIEEYLLLHPNVSLAFQPGTFQMNFGVENLKGIYARTKVFFCNIQEAERILKIDTLGTEELLKRMRELGPEIVVLTDGAKGAYAYDGKDIYFQAPYPDPKPPFERTGAGDAFASTTVVSLILGNDLQTALGWGAINSMSVVQQTGAQKGLLTQEQIKKHLAEAPSDFKAKKLN